VAGLQQAMQPATNPQKLSNRLRLMVEEMEQNSDIQRGLLLDHIYVKSGAVDSKDGTMV
jgi:hypothetical protein